MSPVVHKFPLYNEPRSNYASVPAKNNLKSRFSARLQMYVNLEVSISGYCSRELKDKDKDKDKDKNPLFIEGNTFTSIGCTLPCCPHH